MIGENYVRFVNALLQHLYGHNASNANHPSAGTETQKLKDEFKPQLQGPWAMGIDWMQE
jgi:hypothetical protein